MFGSGARDLVEYRIPADAKYVAFIRKSVRCLAESMDFSCEEAEDVELAVGEAITNSIVHGRPVDGAGVITVRCRVSANELTVLIEDEGRSVCVPVRKDIPQNLDENGRGWPLMNVLMEKVRARCTEHGLLISMTKKHRSDPKPNQGRRLKAAG